MHYTDTELREWWNKTMSRSDKDELFADVIEHAVNKGFFESLEAQFKKGYPLSPKQLHILRAWHDNGR